MAVGASDAKMEEGSMRVDANVSVRRPGAELGTRCEIKNLNSVRSVGRAIEYEAVRQIALIEAGGAVRQETRHWSEGDGKTHTLRTKEDADDYRYFLEPDLVVLDPDEEWIERVRASLPVLPAARRAALAEATGATADAESVVVVTDRGQDAYVLAVGNAGGDVARALIHVKEAFAGEGEEPSLPAADLAALARLEIDGAVTATQAKQVLAELLANGGGDAGAIAREKGFEAMDTVCARHARRPGDRRQRRHVGVVRSRQRQGDGRARRRGDEGVAAARPTARPSPPPSAPPPLLTRPDGARGNRIGVGERVHDVPIAVTQSYEAFFREEFPKMVALGLGLTGERETARDLAQEAMLRGYQRWDTVGRFDRPACWVRRVLINLATDHHRRRRTERTNESRLVEGRPARARRSRRRAVVGRRASAARPAASRGGAALSRGPLDRRRGRDPRRRGRHGQVDARKGTSQARTRSPQAGRTDMSDFDARSRRAAAAMRRQAESIADIDAALSQIQAGSTVTALDTRDGRRWSRPLLAVGALAVGRRLR
ncbi:MAG: sigma factor [Ilumatobacteraceae bacterium]